MDYIVHGVSKSQSDFHFPVQAGVVRPGLCPCVFAGHLGPCVCVCMCACKCVCACVFVLGKVVPLRNRWLDG